MILVLTPLSIESHLLNTALAETGWHSQIEKNGFLSGSLYKEQAVSVYIGGHGKTQFAVQTQYLLHHLSDVRAVLCIGAAGSLTKSVKPGDLVIAEQTIEHDFNLKFIQKPLPAFSADARLLDIARRVGGPHCHFGTVASGDEDILDGVRAGEISAKTSAIAVAWEGAGGARACIFNRVPYLEVRVVTDASDKHAPVDFGANLQNGMKVAAEFLNLFVGSHP